jgi:hypothetical protein
MRIARCTICRGARLHDVLMTMIARISLIAALGLLIPGLTLVTGVDVAFATTPPGHTVASAGTLTIGDTATGGGGRLISGG